MPKITTIELNFDSTGPKKYDIWYTSKDGFEVRGLPYEFRQVTGLGVSKWYNTEAQLHGDLREAVTRYRDMKRNSRLIILYKCSASTALRMNRTSEGHYSGQLNGISRKIGDFRGMSMPLATVGIDFQVANLEDDGVTKVYRRVDMDTREARQKMEVSSEFQVMEFTEERYQFFLDMVSNMQNMVRKLSLFFDADPEKAALFIESNQKLIG